MSAPNASPSRMTLRFTLASVVVGLLVAVVGAVAVVALAVRRKTRDATATFLMTEVVRGVERDTIQRLHAAEQSLVEVVAEAAAGRMPLDDAEALAARFVERMRVEDRVEWVAFATPAATGAYVLRAADGGHRVVVGRADGTLTQERVEPDGRRTAAPSAVTRFADLQDPSWYGLGVASERPTWTPLHARPLDGLPGRASALALRRDGEVRGVFGVGFSTTFASAMLADMWGDRAGMTAFWLPGANRLGAASSADRARALSSVIEAAVAALPGDPQALRPGALHLSTAEHEGRTVVVGLQRVPESVRIPALAVVVIPEDDLVGYFKALGALGLAAVGALLLAGVAVAVGVAHRVARPLRRVAEELGRVGEFDLSGTERHTSRIREVATVGDATAKMKSSLRSFARYVPTEVVRDVLAVGGEARLGGAVRPLTLFFSDIQGFTSLSEGRPPQAVVEELGAYLAVVTTAITGGRGTVDKFVGDGIVAFFNAPRDDAAHAASACRASLGVQAALAAARPGWAATGRPSFPTRIGLHTAEVVVGNIGTPERFAYTVIGDGANYASRLEALNKEYGTWILASRKTHDEAGPGFAWRRVDRTTVAGRAGDDDVFELLGLEGEVAPNVLAARDAYEAAFAAYLARRFDEAAAGFDAAAARRPGDKAAAVLAARARAFAVDAPPPGWTGAYLRRDK